MPCLPSRRHPVELELAALLSLGNYLRALQSGLSDLGRFCEVGDFFLLQLPTNGFVVGLSF